MFDECLKQMQTDLQEVKKEPQQNPSSEDGFGNMTNMFKEFERVSKETQ